jgi:putative transcriptional regulator
MDSVKGQLLIAGPTLADRNFWRTVVLIVEHSDEGALGLVLNRPSGTTVGEAVPQLEDLLELDDPVFIGGPVQTSAMMVLAQFEDPSEAALLAFEDVGVLGATGAQTPSAAVRTGRAFVGHSGWGPEQLDGEIERGDWILEPARFEDAFASEPQALWSRVLMRKGGSYALIARMPPDPSMN